MLPWSDAGGREGSRLLRSGGTRPFFAGLPAVSVLVRLRFLSVSEFFLVEERVVGDIGVEAERVKEGSVKSIKALIPGRD